MSNGPHKAAFWAEFIPAHCQFPDPELLRRHFQHASFTDFCDCGCNNFAVIIPPDVELPPLAPPHSGPGHVAFFESDFHLAKSDRTLEIVLFADTRGYLDYVEVDCCANSYPVPDVIRVKEPPYHVRPAATQCTQPDDGANGGPLYAPLFEMISTLSLRTMRAAARRRSSCSR